MTDADPQFDEGNNCRFNTGSGRNCRVISGQSCTGFHAAIYPRFCPFYEQKEK